MTNATTLEDQPEIWEWARACAAQCFITEPAGISYEPVTSFRFSEVGGYRVRLVLHDGDINRRMVSGQRYTPRQVLEKVSGVEPNGDNNGPLVPEDLEVGDLVSIRGHTETWRYHGTEVEMVFIGKLDDGGSEKRLNLPLVEINRVWWIERTPHMPERANPLEGARVSFTWEPHQSHEPVDVVLRWTNSAWRLDRPVAGLRDAYTDDQLRNNILTQYWVTQIKHLDPEKEDGNT